MNRLKLVVRKFRNFWNLGWNSRWLLLQAFLLLPIVALSLKIWGVKRTQMALARLLIPVKNSDNPSKIIKTIRMVQLAARYYQPWANCLKKSLVLWALLRHQGINSELRIGIRRDTDNFEAHAWVEYEGIAINDTLNVRDRFAMFDRTINVNIL